jgi:hypothetical protein
MDKITEARLKAMANSMHSGIFGTRSTLEEAAEYVNQLANGSPNGALIWTAVGVMLNTISDQLTTVIKDDGAGLNMNEQVNGELFYGLSGAGLIGYVADIQRDEQGRKIIVIHWNGGQVAKFFDEDIRKGHQKKAPSYS